MQQTRDLLELYKILLEVFNKKEDLFICRVIKTYVLFSEEEKIRLNEHFLNQYPTETQYVTFYNHRLFTNMGVNRTIIANYEWFMYEGRNDYNSTLPKLFNSESFELRVKLLETIIANFEICQQIN